MTVIDAPAELCAGCGHPRPESSPSAWFCTDLCQARWTSGNNRVIDLPWRAQWATCARVPGAALARLDHRPTVDEARILSTAGLDVYVLPGAPFGEWRRAGLDELIQTTTEQ